MYDKSCYVSKLGTRRFVSVKIDTDTSLALCTESHPDFHS